MTGVKWAQADIHEAATGNSNNTGLKLSQAVKAAKACGMKVSSKYKALSWKAVKKQINKGRPVYAGINWGDGGGHAVVIRGYEGSSSPGFLYINDPWPVNAGEKFYIRYNSFRYHAFGEVGGSEGKWKRSIYNCKKK